MHASAERASAEPVAILASDRSLHGTDRDQTPPPPPEVDFEKIGCFLPPQQQSQQLLAVTDFKVNRLDVELGVGYGFTRDRIAWYSKPIIGYAFPADDCLAAGHGYIGADYQIPVVSK